MICGAQINVFSGLRASYLSKSKEKHDISNYVDGLPKPEKTGELSKTVKGDRNSHFPSYTLRHLAVTVLDRGTSSLTEKHEHVLAIHNFKDVEFRALNDLVKGMYQTFI